MKKFFLLGAFLSSIVLIGCETPPSGEETKKSESQEKPKQQIQQTQIDYAQLKENLKAFSVFLENTPEGVKLTIAPKFDVSNKPSAFNIAYSTYYAGKYFCESSYPQTGSLILEIAWRDAADMKHTIVVFKGVKADFCHAYNKVKDAKSELKAGYILLNNLQSFPEKKVVDYESLVLICQNDMIAKFCRQF